MQDPYKMIVVSIASSFMLFGGLFFYKRIFPKRKINLLLLLIFISVLPIISIFRSGVYESGDFNIHIYRTIDFYKSLSEGILFPSWAGNLNALYGYPLFIFNYTLPYYLISFFHLIGLSFILSMKLFLALNLILSGIFMFLFSKKVFGKDLPAFITSIFYVFAPYHLIDLHFKVVIGEILFFTILPLVFLFIEKLKDKPTLRNALFFALSFAALIEAHVIIAIFAGILLIFYALFTFQKNIYKDLIIYLSVGITTSLLISLPVWLGPLLLSKYSYTQNVILGTAYFPTLKDLLYSPWRMGLLFQGSHGEISHLLGYAQIFVVISTMFFYLKNKMSAKIHSEALFWLISFFIVVFLILPYSKRLWELFPLLKVVGSHRLLILTAFISSILAGHLTLNMRKHWAIYALATVTIWSTILNWGQRKVVPQINDSFLIANIWRSTAEEEAHFYANTKWVDVKNPWFSELPKNPIEITSGIGNAKSLTRTSTYHKYTVIAQTPLKIQENTLYFPGWKGLANGKEILLSPTSSGIIQTYLPKGNFSLEFMYRDIPIYKSLKVIGFLTLFFTTAILLLSKFKEVKRYNEKH